MWEELLDRSKRLVVLTCFFAAAIWITWRGEMYDDHHHSALPAIMCGVESIVLVITGAAVALRREEVEE
jgi:hypothetical protein